MSIAEGRPECDRTTVTAHIEPSKTLAAKFAVMHKRRHPPECSSLGSPEPQKDGKPMRRREFIAGPDGGQSA